MGVTYHNSFMFDGYEVEYAANINAKKKEISRIEIYFRNVVFTHRLKLSRVDSRTIHKVAKRAARSKLREMLSED